MYNYFFLFITVEILLSGNFIIKGGPLDASYKAVKLNFHWGETDKLGSEHSVLGRKYSGEVRMFGSYKQKTAIFLI